MDPFDCFGEDVSDDDDGDENDVTTQQREGSSSLQNKNLQHRDPSNGILAFHAGTELALLNYVQQQMESDQDIVKNQASTVLGHIDDFCLQRHWMMHVGYEKAPILEQFLKECTEAAVDTKSCLTLVEVGTYCGYSSILIANSMNQSAPDKFHIYSFEVVEQNAKVAREMIRLSGLEERIDVLILDPTQETLSDLLRRSMSTEGIDFLFLDHSKSMYLDDLQQLERTGFIQKGCFVAADNVIFAQIDDYRTYISQLEQRGIVRTRLGMSWLEYCEPDHNGDPNKKNMMKDGIGESFDVVYEWTSPNATF